MAALDLANVICLITVLDVVAVRHLFSCCHAVPPSHHRAHPCALPPPSAPGRSGSSAADEDHPFGAGPGRHRDTL